jgi:DNA-directed RNA polymerase specialized sigma54-like protein
MKRTLVSLPDELFEIMRTKLMGKFGESDSEIIRNIVIAHLSEKGYLSDEKSTDKKEDDDMREEIMSALISILEEKGVITGNDIDKAIKRRLDIKKNLTKFDDLK